MKTVLASCLALTCTTPLFAADNTPAGRYVGILPCADCPAIDVRVDLLADGVFVEHWRYRERAAETTQLGRWQLDSQTGQVQLHDANGVRRFDYAADDRLLPHPTHGPSSFPPPFNGTLYRADQLAPITAVVAVEGAFEYFADSASVFDCVTQQTFPVAMEGAYLNLERAYLRRPSNAESPMWITSRARLTERVNMEGPARATLILEHAAPTDTRPAACAAAPRLETQRWQLESLNTAEQQAQLQQLIERPTINFDPQRGQAYGHATCNRFTADYTVEAQQLRFGPTATTRMACPPPRQGLELGVLSLLESTQRWRIDGDALRLFDGEHRLLGVFRAASPDDAKTPAH